MGPYVSIGAHIKTGRSPMAQDHFQTPPDPTNLIQGFHERLPNPVCTLVRFGSCLALSTESPLWETSQVAWYPEDAYLVALGGHGDQLQGGYAPRRGYSKGTGTITIRQEQVSRRGATKKNNAFLLNILYAKSA